MPRFDSLTPEQLERIRRMIEAVDDALRELVEKHWP
jgi:hypothetical protein